MPEQPTTEEPIVEEQPQEEQPKHPGGRPLKFKDVASLQQKIDEYFGDCDPHIAEKQVIRMNVDGKQYVATEKVITEQKPYTITGLAVALDTSRKVLRDYESGMHDDPEKSESEREQFSNTITRAKVRIEQYAEQHLFTGKSPAGAMFNLKNNYGWEDRTVVDNNNREVEDVLDDLEDKKKDNEEVANEAAKALAEADSEKVPAPEEPPADEAGQAPQE